MDLSIVIVNYNCIEFINKCVDSILSFLPGDSKGNGLKTLSWEVIIIDNYSTDNSIGYLKKIEAQHNNFSLITNKGNKGFSRASNEGARKAKGEFLLFLNPDTEFIKEGIGEVLEFYKNKTIDKGIGIIGVKILNPDNSLQYSCRSFPTISRQFYESFFLYKVFRKSKIFGSYFMSYWDHNSKMEVDWLTGAFMLLKKEIFFMAGGFDENYFIYSEDTDLCLKVKRAGFSNYYFDTFQIKHYDGGVASGNMALRNSQIWESRKIYFFKNYSRAHSLFFSYFYFLGMVNRLVIFFLLYIFNPSKKENRKKIKLFYNTLKLYFSNKKNKLSHGIKKNTG